MEQAEKERSKGGRQMEVGGGMEQANRERVINGRTGIKKREKLILCI